MTKIKCPACGEYILEEIIKNCPHCGYPLQYDKDSEYIDEIEVKEVVEDNDEIEKYIKKFNFGAFLLAPFWCLFNGLPWIFPIFLACWMANTFFYDVDNYSNFPSIYIISSTISIAMGIYLGISGNTLAWDKKAWRNFSHFKSVQKLWARWGIIIWILNIFFIIFLLYNLI